MYLQYGGSICLKYLEWSPITCKDVSESEDYLMTSFSVLEISNGEQRNM